MAEWERENLTLHARHGWRARPGCKILVADRGAFRFDYPQDWVVVPDEDSVKVYDKAPPDDDSRLAVSYLRLPPVDWSELPVAELIEAGMRGDERAIDAWGPIHEMQRGELELAWREVNFLDPGEYREARSRMCIARQANLQCLITFDFWAADRNRCEMAWTTVLETLALGESVADPARGPAVS
ncbi:MAG TPA: hypothetical protein VLH58_08890 [Candidatus Methylomirabilis sp.]|nr:hypothetical protein [Candidatus Methylomirabilis sp.]HSC71455.1 hypothetical protein [Candidatus Methylomirabilis sp.]